MMLAMGIRNKMLQAMHSGKARSLALSNYLSPFAIKGRKRYSPMIMGIYQRCPMRGIFSRKSMFLTRVTGSKGAISV